jgi:hypothetical protein
MNRGRHQRQSMGAGVVNTEECILFAQAISNLLLELRDNAWLRGS